MINTVNVEFTVLQVMQVYRDQQVGDNTLGNEDNTGNKISGSSWRQVPSEADDEADETKQDA